MRRVAAQVREEGRLAAASTAVQASPGHNFKKVLMALAASGSEPARLAAQEQVAHPASVVEDLEGTTLLRAALDLSIVPSDRADTFLSREQQRELAARLDQIDAEAGRSGTELVVATVAGRSVVLRYQGRSIELAEPAPHVGGLGNVDPMPSLVLVVGACSHAITWLNPTLRAPLSVVAPASGATLLGAAVVRRRLSTASRGAVAIEPAPLVVAASVVPAALASLALAGRAPRGSAANRSLHPATHLVFPAVIALALYGRRTSPSLRRPLTAMLAACWALPIARDPIARPERMILGLVWLAEAHLAARGAAMAVDDEVAELQARLRDEFAEWVGGARRSASDRELDRFQAQVELAERELAIVAPALDERLVADIRTECDEVRRWLQQRRADVPCAS